MVVIFVLIVFGAAVFALNVLYFVIILVSVCVGLLVVGPRDVPVYMFVFHNDNSINVLRIWILYDFNDKRIVFI